MNTFLTSPFVDGFQVETPVSAAISSRNLSWKSQPFVPAWVDLDSVGLDRFFTRPEIAQRCHASLMSIMAADGVDAGACRFIEPSAGAGAFFDLLPVDRRLGLDLLPSAPGIARGDFMQWRPEGGSPIVVIGNPPFGSRSWLALAFLNHAAEFADYVGFILPPGFQSLGKGSPRLRVKGMTLVHSEPLPKDGFVLPDGKRYAVAAIWQVWKKGTPAVVDKPACRSIDVFSVDVRKTRACGLKKAESAQVFIPAAFFGASPSPVASVSELKYGGGYGLIVKDGSAERVVSYLRSVDWKAYGSLSSNGCVHIGKAAIASALNDGGWL